jgi:hypothetical protein
VQLVGAVNLAGGEKHVNPAALRRLQGCGGARYVVRVTTRQAADDWSADFRGDGLHGIEVAGRCGGETGFDDVDAQIAQRRGDAQLLAQGHAAAGGLLAVTERGIEDDDPILLKPAHRCSPCG